MASWTNFTTTNPVAGHEKILQSHLTACARQQLLVKMEPRPLVSNCLSTLSLSVAGEL